MATNVTRMIAALAVSMLLSLAAAAQQPAATSASTLTVPEMDCASCAKKLGESLVKVSGVAKVEYDVKAKTIKVLHKAKETPSPKALWEAIEGHEQQPSKLETPGATFTKKPAA